VANTIEARGGIISAVGLVAMLVASRAVADEAVVGDPRGDIRIGAGPTLGTLSQVVNGATQVVPAVGFDLQVLAREHHLTAGVILRPETNLAYSGIGLGLVGGFTWLEKGARLELLGSAGLHVLNNGGANWELLGSDSGVNGTLPFLGGSFGLLESFNPESRFHFTFGLVFYAQTDLGRLSGSLTVPYGFVSTYSRPVSISTWSDGAALVFGVVVDFSKGWR